MYYIYTHTCSYATSMRSLSDTVDTKVTMSTNSGLLR